MRAKRVFSMILLSALVLCLVLAPLTQDASWAAEKVIKWKVQSHWPSASPSYKGSLLVIVDKLKERTNGRFILEPFPSGSLVPAKEIANATKRGMFEMGGTSTAYTRDMVPLSGIGAGLPYSFRAAWEAFYFYKRVGYEKAMKDAFVKHGLLFFTDKIYPTELVLKKPVRTMEDFKGLKLRSSGTLQIFFTSIGAAASYLPGAEVYPALASGVVEGAHWGAAQGANKMGFYDVCKYHLMPSFVIAGTDVYLINKKAFDKLPADIQQTLTQTLDEHLWLRSNQYIFQEAKTLAMVQKEKGVEVITLPPEEQQKMTRAAIKLWDEEAKKDPEYAEWIEKMKEFFKELGYL
ncbi:MAG: TRAP transporter substrate-binding protein DctP [Deltaproteobacteria bacterium]|nr:MAG: TRAP transporter substrate-binding protein DctP [Deltaproteobacteria bacterium]